MESRNLRAGPRYRVWLVECGEDRPRAWSELPARAVALRPLDEGDLDAQAAAAFVEGFNRELLAHGPCAAEAQRHWAVAVEVRRNYEGDLRGGAAIGRGQLAKLALEEGIHEPCAPQALD